MFRKISAIFLLACLNGCVIPVSSSCIDSQQYEHPDANHPAKSSKCDATDAAVYVIAATLKTLENEDKTTRVDTKKEVTCADMVGKSQKECHRKEKALNDPLNEF